MNIDIDYSKYPKDKQLISEVLIDLSGIPVKTGASGGTQDPETGEVTEANLNEIVTENVNFVYTGAIVDKNNTTDGNKGFNQSTGSSIPSFVTKSNYNGVIPELSNTGALTNRSEVPFYATAGEGVESEQDQIKKQGSTFYRELTGYAPTGLNTRPTKYWLTLIPRHKLMIGNSSRSANRSMLVNRQVNAAFGFIGNNNYALPLPSDADVTFVTTSNQDPTKSLGISDNKTVGYISKKYYRKALQELKDQCEANGVDVLVTEFLPNVDVDGNDLNASGLSRGDNYQEIKNASVSFIANKETLAPIAEADLSPFVLSVKEAFKVYFQSSESLYDEFTERYSTVLKGIAGIPGLGWLMESMGLEIPSSFTTSYILKGDSDAPPDDTEAYNTGVGANQSVFNSTNNRLYQYSEVRQSDGIGYPTDETQLEFALKSGGNRTYAKRITIDDDKDIITQIKDLESFINNLIAITAGAAFLVMPILAVITAYLNSIQNDIDSLQETIKKIQWYEFYTNESVFPNKYYLLNALRQVTDGRQIPNVFNSYVYDKTACRLLLAVDFGKKKKKTKKQGIFGVFTKYVYEDIGVRWVQIEFRDTNVYSEYTQDDTIQGKLYNLNRSVSLSKNTSTSKITAISTTDFPIDADTRTVQVTIADANSSAFNGTFNADVINSKTLSYTMSPMPSGGVSSGTITNLIVPYQATRPTENPTQVSIDWQMPYLPNDSQLADLVFYSYGYFDQRAFANRARNGEGSLTLQDEPPQPPAGWEIFHRSSKEISDLRSGIDIYNKVEFLLKILQTEFGASRVHLIDTMRSLEDQNNLQLGGPTSNFLSWHNYGLAVKIKISETNGTDPIREGSADFFKLLDIAEAFTLGCYHGDYGTPCNLVWCGLLATGPDLFVWEFLPIGVGHKDAWKFRDSAFNQQDPVIANSYVNASKDVAVIGRGATPLSGPYIYSTNKYYNDPVYAGGDRWVPITAVQNNALQTASNLILKDVQEFLYLVKNKQNANGTELDGRKIIYEWIDKNRTSYLQLIIYYGLIGNYSSSRGLLSGDYVNDYLTMVTNQYTSDPIAFVKNFLGDFYEQIVIKPTSFADNSYISISTGRMITPVLEARSKQPEGNGNTFGQKRIDFNTVEFGQYRDGVFIPEGDESIVPIVSDEPVISGYESVDDEWVPVGGDALILHKLIADEIVREFTAVRENLESLNIKFMYDKFIESPNFRQLSTLENEFGVIESQDLLTFQQLRDMHKKLAINSKKAFVDGTILGIDSEIYEKLVSTSQQVGYRKVSISLEKPIIEPIRATTNVQNVIEEIENRRTPKVYDIL